MHQRPEDGTGTRPVRESGAELPVRILEVMIGNKAYAGDPLPVTWGEALTVQVRYEALHASALADVYLALAVWRGDALRVVYESTERDPALLLRGGTRGIITCTLPAYLVPALYSVNVGIVDRLTRAPGDSLSNVLFRVTAPAGGDSGGQWDPNRSVLALPLTWSVDPVPAPVETTRRRNA
jgi:hypothetical protein